MEITEDLLISFKKRMKISHSVEDDALRDILLQSLADVTSKCGVVDLALTDVNNIRARELVLERSRYVYNDALEFFDTNFLPQINSLALALYKPSTTQMVEVER